MNSLDSAINKNMAVMPPLGGGRSTELDYMKGILIILVVLGHIPTPLTNWIYLFHIPVFFMISGFCWKTKYANDFKSMKSYVIGKLKRLYVPFVIVNVLFILLNNLFLRIGFYTADSTFLELTSSYHITQRISEPMDVHTMIIGIVNALFFSGGYSRLCGVTWFLSSLFMVCVGHMVLEFSISKLCNKRILILILTLVVCLAISFLIKRCDISLPGIITRFFGCYAAYLCGILFREFNIVKYCNPVLGIIAFAITVVIALIPINNPIDLSKSMIGNPLLFVVLCFSGYVFCYELASLLVRLKIKPIGICGKESMAIFLFHPISFKIVTFMYLLLLGRPMILLATYLSLDGESTLLPVLYLIVGVVVPLICDKYYSLIMNKVKALNKN